MINLLVSVKALGKNSAVLLPAEEITDPEFPSKWIPELDDEDDDFYVMEEEPAAAPKKPKKEEKKKKKSKLLEGTKNKLNCFDGISIHLFFFTVMSDDSDSEEEDTTVMEQMLLV